MRRYSVVHPRFWTQWSKTGTAVRKLGPEATVVALYLITSPHSNALGLYYLPLSLLSEEVDLPLEQARKVLEAVCATGFAEYLAEESAVWVPQMARYQIGAKLSPGDRKVAWARREPRKLEGTGLAERFLERYGEAYHLLPKGSQGLRLVENAVDPAADSSSRARRPRGKATDPPGPSRQRMDKARALNALLQESRDEC